MICPSCSKPNSEDVSFCEFCGANLLPGAATSGSPSAYSATHRPSTPPSAAEVAQMGKSLLGSLNLGERLVGVGAVAATLGFFLPFISMPDLSGLANLLSLLGQNSIPGIANGSLSLFNVAKLLGVVYFVLLASIGSGVLLYFSRGADYSRKMLFSGFQVMIGSIVGPGYMICLLFVPMVQSFAGTGFWLLGLGFCSIAAGGLISIAQLAKTAY